MISQKYIDLMNQELDGANTPDQTRELEAYLQEDPAARDHYRELALTLNLFEKVAMVDPPPGLTATILEQAAARTERPTGQPVESEPPGWWAACLQFFQGKPRLAYALTFTTGLTCGLLLLTGSSWLDNRHGTELNGQVVGTASVRPWDLESVTEGEWHDSDIQGLYRMQQEGQDLRLHLRVLASKPSVVRFSHGPGTSLKFYNADNPAPVHLAVSQSQVELNLNGRGSYDLEFHGIDESASLIEMTVYSEGRLVHSELLDKGE